MPTASTPTSDSGFLDASLLLNTPPPAIEWAVQGILPKGTVGDVFGPPGEGKSTLLLDLAMAVASGSKTWLGRACMEGTVVILGGEREGNATFSRDLHRISQGRTLPPGRLLVPDCESQPPLWKWTTDKWDLTSWGEEITKKLRKRNASLVILDTQLAVTEGTNQLDNTQQYAFGVTLRAWAKTIGNPVVLTVSHTNQGSASQSLAWRLHYLSRAGGNGLPGALRWAAGLSRLRPDDDLARQLGLEQEASKRWLIALAVSKANEMPRATWSTENPAVLEIRENGSLGLLPGSMPRKPAAAPKAKRQVVEDLSWLTPADDGLPLPPILARIPESADEL